MSACLILASLWLAGMPDNERLCLKMEGELKQVSTLFVRIGEETHLRFRHSIYGSEVEEQFRIARGGLQLFRLRYAEARLAEFYGHDNARFEQGWWVVKRDYPMIPTLHLRVSPESSLSLSLGSARIPLSELAIPDGLVRVRVIPCEKGNDGQ